MSGMAEKMTCPACDSHTSAVLSGFNDGSGCPYCGLSASAIAEVLDAERRAVTEEMAEKVRQAVVERDKAQAEARELRGRLSRLERDIRAALNDENKGPSW